MTRIFTIAALILFTTTSFAFAESRAKEVRQNQTASAPLNVSCIQNAIEKRDSVIIVAHNTFNASITNALTVRKDALKLAWAKATRHERTPARKATYEAFKTAQKSAHEALRSTRKSSWSTFNNEMKACGISKEAHGERASEVKEPTSSL